MSTKRYETRWITIFIYGNGKFRIISDGLVNSGEWSACELEKQISQLSQEGWQVVSSIDRKECGNPYPAMDLYFRRDMKHASAVHEVEISPENVQQSD